MNDAVPSSFDVPISSYSDDVDVVLESLTRPPLNLPPLDEYVPKCDVDRRIIANLTLLRDEFRLFLPATIRNIVPLLPKEQSTQQSGRIYRYENPRSVFAGRLEQALTKIREDAKVWLKLEESLGRDAESLQKEREARERDVPRETRDDSMDANDEIEDAEKDAEEVYRSCEESEEEVETYEGPSRSWSGVTEISIKKEPRGVPSSASSDFQIISPTPKIARASPNKRLSDASVSPLKRPRHGELDSPNRESQRQQPSPQTMRIDGHQHNKSLLKPARPCPTISAAPSVSALPRKSASTDTIDTTLTYPSSRESSPTLKAPAWTPRPPLPLSERVIPILARNPYQHVLDAQNTHFAVQWEFEREIARSPTISWGDVIRPDIDRLRGSAEEAMPAVSLLVKDIEARKAGTVVSPGRHTGSTTRKAQMYVEMDKEEVSIRANDLRGVGNSSVDWPYGGKIIYSVVVEPVKPGGAKCFHPPIVTFPSTPTIAKGPIDPPGNPFSPNPTQELAPKPLPFTMALLPPNMPGKSYRLARRFGSRRILSMKLKNLEFGSGAKVMDFFLGREFALFGKRFAPMWAPPDKDVVLVVEVGGGMPEVGRMLSVYNDLEQKPGQAMAKWAARPQILFSDSIPATTVDSAAIGHAPDLITCAATASGHASTEQTLTDGCGLMSESLARRIFQNPSLRPDSGWPCVVQIRLAGSKGLLASMSPAQHQDYAGKEVVLRDPMIKSLPHPTFADDISLRTLDVLRCDALRIATTLSSEAIICMVHNGVSPEVFLKTSRESLAELRIAFLPRPVEVDGRKMETEMQVIKRIVRSCYTIGGVGGERKRRTAVDEGKNLRSAGLEKDRGSKAELEEDVGDQDGDLIDLSEKYGVDPVSGQSGSIAESLMEAVAAGFHPATSAYTAGKLHYLLAALISARLRKFKIPVAESLSAFIIPDSLQILAPNEIHISFSGMGPIDPITQCPLTHLQGDVLAFRSPCKLPTDIQKFKAVYKPELSHLTNCVVMSAQATNVRSPARKLAGGDYDGDTVQLFWAKELVEGFTNADESFTELPKGFEKENFDKEVVKGSELLDVIERGKLGEDGSVMGMQEFLLGALKDEKLAGQYSDLHGNAVYMLGYDHPETVRLARMFCLVLDARKSGLKVKTEVKKRDLKAYHGNLEWRKYKKDMGDDWNEKMLDRPRQLGDFVMDMLQRSGIEKSSEIMRDFPSSTPHTSKICRADYDALSPLWLRAKSHCEGRRPELRLLRQVNIVEKHVQACHDIWGMIRSRRLDRSTSVLLTYQNIMAGGSDVVKPSPRRNGGFERSDSQKVAKTPHEDLIMLTSKRDLAAVWAEELKIGDLPDLLPLGDESSLKRLMISCGVCLSAKKFKGAQQLFIFDVDFRTTCAMKAEYSGFGSMTMIEDVGRDMKPVPW